MAKKRPEATKMNAATTSTKAKKTNAATAGTKRKPIRLDVPPKDYDRAEACATARGLTMSSYARMALLELIKRHEKEAAE